MPLSYANVVNSTSTPPSAQHPTPPSAQHPTMPRSDATASLQDPYSNLLYVHNADHPGITLVSEKLTGLGNFNTWRRSMLMALGARNKVVFVDGTYPELLGDHPDFASWSRCNNIVCTWIVNAEDKPIAESVMYLDIARRCGWIFMTSSSRAMGYKMLRLNIKSLLKFKVHKV